MPDHGSDYPTAIDRLPVTLEDEVDHVPADALSYLASMIEALQTEIGLDPVRFQDMGGFDFATIAAFILARTRIESGTQVTHTQGDFRVHFTEGRFTEPPFVAISNVMATSPGIHATLNPKKINREGFTIGTGHQNLAGILDPSPLTILWVAIQPPFGIEQTLESES
ncbi:MAG: hypothetical protein DWQ01_08570 [Planctomycetota bacterium]|nr:MAG: hypothetical protein DWQ01_08570 [Planctomycetota bacterium]